MKNKKLLLSSLIIILLVGGVLAALWYRHSHKHPDQTSGNTQQTSPSGVNLNPPTSQERQETDQHKQSLENQTSTPTSANNNGKKQVTPIITYADKTRVNAYVTGVFEDGGTCTATLTQGSQTITATSSGFENASYTQCAPIDLSNKNLGSSPWALVVSYSSNSSEGQSQSTTIKP